LAFTQFVKSFGLFRGQEQGVFYQDIFCLSIRQVHPLSIKRLKVPQQAFRLTSRQTVRGPHIIKKEPVTRHPAVGQAGRLFGLPDIAAAHLAVFMLN